MAPKHSSLIKHFMRKIIWVLCLCCSTALYAHVGSPDVVMDGNAGPYKIMIMVKPPDVIPGIARVTVFMQEQGVQSLTVRSVYYRTGDEGSPEADPMKQVEGLPGQYTGETWLMNGGSSSVQIHVKGDKGNGEILCPLLLYPPLKKTFPLQQVMCLLGRVFFFLS